MSSVHTEPTPTETESNTPACDNAAGEGCTSRRVFLTGLFGFFAAIWAVGAAYPLFRYLLPKDDPSQNITEMVVGKLADVPPGSAKNFKMGSMNGIVINDKSGKLYAYNAKCSHLGCTVQYRDDLSNIYCACHGGMYDFHTGKNISGPPPKPLDLLKVEVVKDDIVVKRA